MSEGNERAKPSVDEQDRTRKEKGAGNKNIRRQIENRYTES